MPQFIQIDLSKLDNEILIIEKRISILKKELEMKQDLKKYAVSISVKDNSPASIEITATPTDTQKIKVSEFIIEFLGESKHPTKDIVIAYANKIGSIEEKVYNNVSNALSRLKADNKVNSESIGIGRRSGYNWFTVK